MIEAKASYSVVVGGDENWKPTTPGNDLFVVIKKGAEQHTAVTDDAGNSWVKIGPALWCAYAARSVARITVNFAGSGFYEVEAYERLPAGKTGE
jgi:hypothetical protein